MEIGQEELKKILSSNVNFKKLYTEHSELKLKIDDMNKTMVLRGPDESGVYLDENFGMAVRRLSIIDLETGSQPIVSGNESIAVILNGEIYNYIELRSI